MGDLLWKLKMNMIDCKLNLELAKDEIVYKVEDIKDNIVDKVDDAKNSNILLMDIDTEGRKRGYNRAAKEYEPQLERLQQEGEKLKKIIQLQKKDDKNKVERLLDELDRLEKEKYEVDGILNNIKPDVAKKYNISMNDINISLRSDNFWKGICNVTGYTMGGMFGLLGIVKIVSDYKRKKLEIIEVAAYEESRQTYMNKIIKLKRELVEIKYDAEKKHEEFIQLIIDISLEISRGKTAIVQLKSMI